MPVRGELSDETARALEAGVIDRGEPLRAAAVAVLKRVAFGGLELGDLAPGKWRNVSEQETRAAFPNGPIWTRRQSEPRSPRQG